MQTHLPTLDIKDSVGKAIDVLTSHSESALPVFDDGKLVGELSQHNLLLKIIGRVEVSDEPFSFESFRDILAQDTQTIAELYDSHEFILSSEDEVELAARIMYENEVSCICVLEKGAYIGSITDVGILKHYKNGN